MATLTGDGHKVALVLLRQSHAPEVRRHLLACDQGPKIEGLQHHALLQVMLAHLGEKQAHKFFRRRRVLGLVGEALRLDIEIELAELRQAEHFVKRRHLCARRRNLIWEIRVLHRTAIPFAYLGERQLVDHGARPGAVANRRFENRIMRDDDHVIPRDSHVHFESIDASFDGVLEGRDRVFGPHGARAAVPVHQDALTWRGRLWHKTQNYGNNAQPAAVSRHARSVAQRLVLFRRSGDVWFLLRRVRVFVAGIESQLRRLRHSHWNPGTLHRPGANHVRMTSFVHRIFPPTFSLRPDEGACSRARLGN